VDIMVDACAGVGALHEAGVIHRDLTPRNLFLAKTSMGELTKVVDFGIAKLASGGGAKLTTAGMVIGTKDYMAPEQTRADGKIDARTDQFTLGVVLYECLTGRRPHEGADRKEVVKNIREGRFASPRSRRPQIPPELESIILQAMDLTPANRFPTVHELGAALVNFASPDARSRWSLTGVPRHLTTTSEVLEPTESEGTVRASQEATQSGSAGELERLRMAAGRDDTGTVRISAQATREVSDGDYPAMQRDVLAPDVTSARRGSGQAAPIVPGNTEVARVATGGSRGEASERLSERGGSAGATKKGSVTLLPSARPAYREARNESVARSNEGRGTTEGTDTSAPVRSSRTWIVAAAVLVGAVVGGGAWYGAGRRETPLRSAAATQAPGSDVHPAAQQPGPVPPPVALPAPRAASSQAVVVQPAPPPREVPNTSTSIERVSGKRAEQRHHHRKREPAPEPIEYTPNGTPILR
jgi:hypothetical protein